MIFVGSGFIDSLIKFIQANYIHEWHVAAFSTSVFITAFACNLIVIVIKKKTLNLQFKMSTLVLGTLLGVTNFRSLYYFINA